MELDRQFISQINEIFSPRMSGNVLKSINATSLINQSLGSGGRVSNTRISVRDAISSAFSTVRYDKSGKPVFSNQEQTRLSRFYEQQEKEARKAAKDADRSAASARKQLSIMRATASAVGDRRTGLIASLKMKGASDEQINDAVRKFDDATAQRDAAKELKRSESISNKIAREKGGSRKRLRRHEESQFKTRKGLIIDLLRAQGRYNDAYDLSHAEGPELDQMMGRYEGLTNKDISNLRRKSADLRARKKEKIEEEQVKQSKLLNKSIVLLTKGISGLRYLGPYGMAAEAGLRIGRNVASHVIGSLEKHRDIEFSNRTLAEAGYGSREEIAAMEAAGYNVGIDNPRTSTGILHRLGLQMDTAMYGLNRGFFRNIGMAGLDLQIDDNTTAMDYVMSIQRRLKELRGMDNKKEANRARHVLESVLGLDPTTLMMIENLNTNDSSLAPRDDSLNKIQMESHGTVAKIDRKMGSMIPDFVKRIFGFLLTNETYINQYDAFSQVAMENFSRVNAAASTAHKIDGNGGQANNANTVNNTFGDIVIHSDSGDPKEIGKGVVDAIKSELGVFSPFSMNNATPIPAW